MKDTVGRSRDSPRFPCVVAALCAACVVAAGWTWLRCSCYRELTPSDVLQAEADPDRSPEGLLVYLRCHVPFRTMHASPAWGRLFDIVDPADRAVSLKVLAPFRWIPRAGQEALLAGRVRRRDPAEGGFMPLGPGAIYLDTTAGRLAGESVAGLVVGAMGICLFGMALGHWLRERCAPRQHRRRREAPASGAFGESSETRPGSGPR